MPPNPPALGLSKSPAVNPFDSAQGLSLSTWFAEEVQPHEPALRAYLQRKFPALTDIDDLMQESYVRLIRARNTGVVLEPKAYLFRTARNAAFDVFRRKRNISIEELEKMAPGSVVEDRPDAAEAASHVQEIEILTDAIQSLPDRCREILTLRKLHGLTYREIARRLGISENTVNAQLAIGMVRCRQHLEARGVLNRDNARVST